jgi:hypothetical protein
VNAIPRPGQACPWRDREKVIHGLAHEDAKWGGSPDPSRAPPPGSSTAVEQALLAVVK